MFLETHYIHGTHVAGIALEGNPFGRMLVVRLAFPDQVPPPPTLAGARKLAAGVCESRRICARTGLVW